MKILCKNKNWEINKDYNIDKILYLLIDRSTLIYIRNYYNLIWRNKKNQLHREYDLPALINTNGYMMWVRNDSPHRENNNPIGIDKNGEKEYL